MLLQSKYFKNNLLNRVISGIAFVYTALFVYTVSHMFIELFKVTIGI